MFKFQNRTSQRAMIIFITDINCMAIHKQVYVSNPKHKNIQIHSVSKCVKQCGACNNCSALLGSVETGTQTITLYYVFRHAPAISTRVPSSSSNIHTCSIMLQQYPHVFHHVPAISTRVPLCSSNIYTCSVMLQQYPHVFHYAPAISTRVPSCSSNVYTCSIMLQQYPHVFHHAPAISTNFLSFCLSHVELP